MRRKHVRDLAGIERLERMSVSCWATLSGSQGALAHCAARRRCGEPISTAFAESPVNEIVAKRMDKKQHMRWGRTPVQPFLDSRTAVLNDSLEDVFRYRYFGFRPANGNEITAPAAEWTPEICMLSDGTRSRSADLWIRGFLRRCGPGPGLVRRA
jgi:hypothetical protein